MLPTVYVSVSPFVLTCDTLQGAFTKVKKYRLQLPAFCEQILNELLNTDIWLLGLDEVD